jgi:hypothetical protein
MKKLDEQLIRWKDKLLMDVRVPADKYDQIATIMAKEIDALSEVAKEELKTASPIDVSSRIKELSAFQKMMDTFNRMTPIPEVVRAQVITQNYICFVYLKESLFETLKRVSQPETITKKCCKFLSNNPVRAFRNSIAHGNWTYKHDSSGLDFWARKGESRDEPMVKWEVSQDELNFWQALSRTVAYTAYLTLTK